jgi:selenocysteine lyase/cysteine desulfurase
MATIRLPVAGAAAPEAARALRARLLALGTDVPVHALQGALWLRISAAVYNEAADYERLGDLLTKLL